MEMVYILVLTLLGLTSANHVVPKVKTDEALTFQIPLNAESVGREKQVQAINYEPDQGHLGILTGDIKSQDYYWPVGNEPYYLSRILPANAAYYSRYKYDPTYLKMTFPNQLSLKDYSQIETGFTCLNRIPGVYGSLSYDCRVFYTCEPSGYKSTFCCHPKTRFNSITGMCDNDYNVDFNCKPKYVPPIYRQMKKLEEELFH